MAITLTRLTDLAAHGFDDIIDVRAPAEFAEDHLPGAISLPVLDDDERARVGTIYKQVSPFTARKLGAALVARNAARHLEEVLADRPGGWRPLVYCWRGGQRSGSFALILGQVGWRVETIAGGYKAWRGLVVQALCDAPPPPRVSSSSAADISVAGSRQAPASRAANQSTSARRAWCATSASSGRDFQVAAWSARTRSGFVMVVLLTRCRGAPPC